MKQSVTFKNKTLTLAGELFFPEDFDKHKSYPAIVIAHPEGAVKEQVPETYAEKLASYGFIVLTFDGAYMGESEGEPHFTTDPFQRVEDIRSAVDYLTTLTYVDNGKISGLGICAGGAYMIDAAKTEKRFKAVSAVVPVNMGAGMRESQPNKETLVATLTAAANQRTAEVNGAEVQLMETVAADDEATMQFTEHSLFREARSYYRGVKKHPRSTGQIVFSGFDKLLRYDAYDMMSEMWSHPLLVFTGSLADTRPFAEQAVQLAGDLAEDLVVVKGATHVDLYYKDQFVNSVVNQIAEFFSKHLNK
ncbi:alpha/beta hydrolase [Streptococcus hyointestinalis]|uniref:alpha/beta hydrolase n=1 Tax=Streptococcus hyointestinalis TaxID=1337 RepID=UPI003D00514B